MNNYTALLVLCLGMLLTACNNSSEKIQIDEQDVSAPVNPRKDTAPPPPPANVNSSPISSDNSYNLTDEELTRYLGEDHTGLMPPPRISEFVPKTLLGFDFVRQSSRMAKQGDIQVSMGEADFRNGDRSVKFNIADYGDNMKANRSVQAWFGKKLDHVTETGYERVSRYQGIHHMMEMTQNNGAYSKVTLILGNRFLVTLTGKNVPVDDLKVMLGILDIETLLRITVTVLRKK